MSTVKYITERNEAATLARRLNQGSYERPIVVVTIPAGRETSWIDADSIADEAGDLAEIHVMPTGPLTWEFSNLMSEGTQVYGGAGRVYPVGREWIRALARSPLRFAFNELDGRQATEQLVSDALRMAVAAGLTDTKPRTMLREVSGTVSGIIAGRALVNVGAAFPATIAGDLTVDGVAIDHIVQEGQRVAGLLDPETNRLDIRGALRSPREALQSYRLGDIVLAKVMRVESGEAELLLYPETSEPAVTTKLSREDVTSNPLDDLRDLMTVDEVVAARVSVIDPKWALILHDVDDDEPIVEAVSLLAGGPPWLIEDSEPEEFEPVDELPVALPAPSAIPEAELEAFDAATEEVEVPEERRVATPLDAMRMMLGSAATPSSAPREPETVEDGQVSADVGTELDIEPQIEPQGEPAPSRPSIPLPGPPGRRVPVATAPAVERTAERSLEPAPSYVPPVKRAAPPGVTKELLRTIDGLKAQVAKQERDVRDLQVQLRASNDDKETLEGLYRQEQRRANRHENELKSARSRLRKAGASKGVARDPQRPTFADPEQGFRYLVLTSWATRIQPSEQDERPLPPYRIGPNFLDSLENLEGIKLEKVADVAMEILTDLAPQLPGREVHRLRAGSGGDDQIRIRQEDGAVAWRASLQVKTPSARRIHYWALPDGGYELARVSVHDDFEV